ncbi:hypothetical protein [Pseudomonas promysalinigenes]|uniref:hypothetical protein n=1 Tax=Pseudomonas promysalinigenes TaxID=485898 RepID=UPI0016443EC6|nr:hypothetical protein [Pseudomonas promysalinigenes]QXI35284.1 hypothetical protein HU725_008125 [Pseudomonas promysalinigenes]
MASAEDVAAKRHVQYFRGYFDTLGAQTIIVEKDYVDRDYLQDYAAYYDRCFHNYARRTTRLHFFKSTFGACDLKAKILSRPGDESEIDLQESYLGFIVVKPLPVTIIGRTCLKTYDSDNGRRSFPSLRAYAVNLFGIQLEVVSLAYQEQDTVVAACATSALWTCLQGTGKLFQHHIPAPVEITRWAGDQLPENLLSAGARAFPNSGLTARQMAHAIKGVGLEPFVVSAGTPYHLNSIVYAYLKGKIPSILAFKMTSYEDHEDRIIGNHAVAVTGFSLSAADARIESPIDFNLRSSRIDKLYVHDDQTGPFSRMGWATLPTPSQMGGEFALKGLTSSWSERAFATPDFILFPLYEKIRIPFSLIHDSMAALSSVLEFMREISDSKVECGEAEWDIFLTTAGDYKTSVRDEYFGSATEYSACFFVDLPRFLWRVTVRTDEKVQMDILFDATGIAQHDLLVHFFSARREYYQMLSQILLPEYEDLVALLPLQARAVIAATRGAGA